MKSLGLVIVLFFTSCKGSSYDDVGVSSFAFEILIGESGALYKNNLKKVKTLEVYCTENLRGIISREELARRSFKKFTIRHPDLDHFFDSLTAGISLKVTCNSVQSDKISYHLVLLDSSHKVLGYAEVRESLACSNIGFIKITPSIIQIDDFGKFKNLLHSRYVDED